MRCGDLLDRIPDPVVEEMCQLVKANSIEGCKRASVMVVWTPWANLHKDETCMQAGAVGFHDSKLRRLRRIDKDKSIVKKLEKTRREAHPDLQQERLQYERDAIRWRKNRDKANRDSKNAREKAERDAARREIEERHAARDAFLAGRERAAAAAGPVSGRRARGRAARRAVPREGGAAARGRRHVWFGCGPVAAGG